jgi:hypothetical protein
MNLMPKKFLKRQELAQKQPYFIAAVFSLVLVVLAFGAYYSKLASLKTETLSIITGKSAPLKQTETLLNRELAALDRLKQENAQLVEWSEQRFVWPDLLTELRAVLKRTEDLRTAQMGGVPNGVWIEKFSSANPNLVTSGSTELSFEEEAEPQSQQVDPKVAEMLAKRYGLPTAKKEESVSPAARAATNEVGLFNVSCRAVSLRNVEPSADDKLMFALQSELRNSPMFDPEGTKLAEEIKQDANQPTFSFGLTLKLKNPIKL